MKIKRIIVKNFRLLKDFSIDLEDELSLIVGKNNVGKTSLLLVLDKFLNGSSIDSSKKIKYNDLNLDMQKKIEKLLDTELEEENEYKPLSVSLRIIVEYKETDCLDNINKILTNLDVGNNYFAIGFDYVLDYDRYKELHKDFNEAKAKYDADHEGREDVSSFDKKDFLDTRHQKYFHIVRKSIDVKVDNMELDEDNYVDLSTVQGFRMDSIFNFQFISARRNVNNKDVDKTLSEKTSNLYKAQEESDENKEARGRLIDHLKDTDKELTELYGDVFAEILKKIEKLGGMKQKETVIRVISNLQHSELLKGNTTVVYEHDDMELPENYNGLGYMNLIAIIFDISFCVEKMKRANERRPADINLLFIEEPEAHTHPQMQYIFIKNIKDLLKNGIKREDGANASLQYIVSTHSSHIVADSDFDDVKYLRREEENSVKSKNLKSLKEMYADEDDAYRFLKQYLTLINSELFFADKAIFVEGDTERILLPVMMQKIDENTPPDKANGELGLLSQNISLIPIGGAYSHIFDKFFHFIGLSKILVITDLDIGKQEGRHKKCEYIEGTNQVTTNAALKYYFGHSDVSYYVSLADNLKLMSWNNASRKMTPCVDGNMRIAYETKENGYQARSFEDCFFKKNETFMCNASFAESALNGNLFEAYKTNKDAFKLAEDGVESKSALAVGILLAENDGNKWEVPDYIKEGLLWLRK